MKLINKNIILILILLLAGILRVYQLDVYPALNADEASIGYDAYSLIETGKDQHGNSWPIHFQSFNDYKPGGYVYAVLPFVYLFGLNEWSVRLPGAIFGIFTVLAVYLLARELNVGNSKLKIVSALLLAISPWHIHFSRGGWEVNMATFLITLGLYFFVKAQRQMKYLVISVLLLTLSLYTYHAARVIVPLLGLGLLAIYRKTLLSKDNLRLSVGAAVFVFVLVVPLMSNFFGDAVSSRASGVSILADRGYIDRINEKRGRHDNPSSIVNRLIYNRPKEIAIEFGKNYLEHFWGDFLFISGDDIERNKVSEFGQLYMWQLFALVVGVVAVVKKQKEWGVVVLWLLLAPIPAALTFQSPHALRAQSMIIPLIILSALGLCIVLDFIKRKVSSKTLRTIFYLAISLVIVWDFSRYLHNYWVHMSKAYPYSSQYGVKELVSYLANEQSHEKNIIITTRYDQPYILFLFYLKYPPKQFQNDHVLSGRDEYGFSTVPTFDRYEFRKINYDTEWSLYQNSVVAGTDEEIVEGANVIKNIYGTNGFLYFQVVR